MHADPVIDATRHFDAQDAEQARYETALASHHDHFMAVVADNKADSFALGELCRDHRPGAAEGAWRAERLWETLHELADHGFSQDSEYRKVMSVLLRAAYNGDAEAERVLAGMAQRYAENKVEGSI